MTGRHRSAARRWSWGPAPDYLRILAWAVIICLGSASVATGVILYRAVQSTTEWVPPERGVIREH